MNATQVRKTLAHRAMMRRIHSNFRKYYDQMNAHKQMPAERHFNA